MDFPGGASSSGAGQASEQQLMDEVTLRVLLHQLYLLRVSTEGACVADGILVLVAAQVALRMTLNQIQTFLSVRAPLKRCCGGICSALRREAQCGWSGAQHLRCGGRCLTVSLVADGARQVLPGVRNQAIQQPGEQRAAVPIPLPGPLHGGAQLRVHGTGLQPCSGLHQSTHDLSYCLRLRRPLWWWQGH